MENEEKEDLLIDVSDESESEISDYCIQEKIFRLLETEQSKKSWSSGLLFVLWCLILFISSTIVIISLPIYQENSRRCEISSYSKLATLSTVNLIIFTSFYAVNKCFRPRKTTASLYFCLPKVLKASLLLAFGSITVFLLSNAKVISCHLEDPLKGCVVVFSLLFYFIFSKRKTSVERVFCSITVIVGTFVTVDFGLCDRFRCRGADLPVNLAAPIPLHAVYVMVYILALAAYALHFICLENFCRCCNYSSSLDMSIVSNSSTRERSTATPMPITHSLSIISGARVPRDQLNVSIPSTHIEQDGGGNKFPVTSTPNERSDAWVWNSYDWLAAHHAFAWFIVVMFCWVPTLGFYGKEPRLLVSVLEDVVQSFSSHTLGVDCPSLWLPSTIMLASYVVMCISSVTLLCESRSALLVVCVIMNALPMASLFWSVYQLDPTLPDVISFKMGVTGEAVSAMVGFPIIGIGTYLIIKAHLSQAQMHLRLR